MRLSVACVLLLIAVAFPLILDGQVFTNSLIGIVFGLWAFVVAMISYSRADVKSTKQFWCALTGGVAAVLVVALAVKLPNAYAFQSSFNRQLDAAQQRERVAVGEQKQP